VRQRSAEATRVMALARIITRSEECARELSQDLLARGYAVEVVSPDEIPGHTADLELRVETGDGKKLTANVKVQHGEHSASLDFVHHLKPTVAEVSRPEWQQALKVQSTNPSAPFTIAAHAKEESKLPANAPALAKTPDRIAPQVVAEIPLRPVLDTEVASKTTPHPRIHRSEGWLWRASLGFAAMVLLALIAGFGMNGRPLVSHAGETGAIAGTAPIQVMAPSANASESTALNPLAKPSVNSDPNRIEAAEQKTGPATRSVASEATGKSVHDLVARDTVTYLDERYKPAPKTQPTNRMVGRQAAPRKHGGVIAANSVTDLSVKPTSKPK
jgi:hypothetical protein